MKKCILVTSLGCLICVICALIIAWLGGRYEPQTVLANENTETAKKSVSAVKTEGVMPQWLFFHSVGGTADEEEKAYLDVLVNRWTKGNMTDDELSDQMTEYLSKHGKSISTMGVQSRMLCVFSSENDLPDYAQMLADSKESGIYDFIGVYTDGDRDEEGRLICYYWEAGVMGA